MLVLEADCRLFFSWLIISKVFSCL